MEEPPQRRLKVDFSSQETVGDRRIVRNRKKCRYWSWTLVSEHTIDKEDKVTLEAVPTLKHGGRVVCHRPIFTNYL